MKTITSLVKFPCIRHLLSQVWMYQLLQAIGVKDSAFASSAYNNLLHRSAHADAMLRARIMQSSHEIDKDIEQQRR
jgi:hypothetical protein